MRQRIVMLAVLSVFAFTAGGAQLSAQQTSWLAADVRAERDNQPRDLLHITAVYGRYLSPNFTLAGTLAALQTASGSTVEPGLAATAGVPAARLGIALGARTLLGGPAGATPLLWSGRAAVNVGAGVSLRARHARDRYIATLASLDTALLVVTAEAALDRAAAPGWAGELVARHESFADGNPVSTAYGWVLAPLSRSARHSLRTGYSLAWQDAAESRWVVADERYAPYYTPHDVVIHNVLLAAALAAGRGWIVADAAYGVYARELAPTQQLTFHERSFSPWRAALTWTVPLQTHVSLTTRLSHERTAFYRTTMLNIGVVRAGAR